MNLKEKYPKNFENCIEVYIPSGWTDIINTCIDEIIELDPDIQILQIKEKFAELRIYVSGTTQAVYKILEKYNDKISNTCQLCGKEGELRINRGWYSILCDNCQNEKYDNS